MKRVCKTVAEIVVLAVLIFLAVFLYRSVGFAEATGDVTEAYVLCSDFVYVRPHPNRKGEPVGRFDAGDTVYLDGKKKNGFMHCVDTHMESDGWVFAGFIVYDKPIHVNQRAVIVSKGRLAARKYIKGKRTRWLKPLASLTVYYWSDEWCVTNCGYVQTRFLELEGE